MTSPVWLKALGKQSLDVTLATHRAYSTRIVERPGMTLDDEALAALVAQLRVIAAKTLPAGSLTYGVFTGNREHLSRSVITLITDRATGQPVAFNALALMAARVDGEATEITHLGLVMVDPDLRGQGLSWVLYGLTTLLLFVRGGLRPRWVSNVTQVPAIVGMVAETFADVFPSPDEGARQSFAHLHIARHIMASQRHVFGVGEDAGFDEARAIITNAYTGGSDDLKKRFDEAAPHREARYNDFCQRELDYTRGDDVLQLGRIDMACARRYLVGQVPRASLPAILGAAAFMIVQRLVLPIMHWFDHRRRFGSLRPWAAKEPA
jgi:hypothetical protein